MVYEQGVSREDVQHLFVERQVRRPRLGIRSEALRGIQHREEVPTQSMSRRAYLENDFHGAEQLDDRRYVSLVSCNEGLEGFPLGLSFVLDDVRRLFVQRVRQVLECS